MMKLFDMNKLILDLYAGREQLLAEVADLYAELEHESYEREQFEIELNKANKEIGRLRRVLYEELTREDDAPAHDDTEPDEEVPDHHDAFDSMFPGCTPDDLPFPDVEDLAPASEVLGGDE